MSAQILVAGIGNVFLGDDGFGVEVVRRLACDPLPEGVVVADIGIRSLRLAYALLEPPELLFVVDAVDRGDPPGTLSLIEPRDVTSSRPEIPDAHGMNLDTVLAMVRMLGGHPPPILLLGCEPAFIGEHMGLSPIVEDVIPAALEIIRAAIARKLDAAVAQTMEGRA